MQINSQIPTLSFALALLVTACHNVTPSGNPPYSTPAISATTGAPSPEIPLEDYFEIRRLKDASFNHDETRLAFLSDRGGRLDIWVQPVAGGDAQQITTVDGRIYAFAFSPTTDQLLYEVDQGGNGKPRLYMIDNTGSEARELLPELPQGARIGFIRWAPDGESLLYITNLPKQDFVEIWQYQVATGTSDRLWKSPSHLAFALASPTFDRLILQQIHSDVNFDLYSLERGSEEPKLLTPHEGDATYFPTDFSPDGKTLYYTSTAAGEFTALYALDFGTSKHRMVHQDSWDVEAGKFSNGGRYFYRVVNANGTPRVDLENTRDGTRAALPEAEVPGAFVPVAFSPSDRYMVATLVSDVVPKNLYLLDLVQQRQRAIEHVLPPTLRDQPMVAARDVIVRSFDGLEIPALLYQPPGEGPFPAVIHVHGGPHAQAKRIYSGFRQYLVAQGFVVMVPNVRGSTGYGKTFTSLDNLDLGGGPLQDVVACKRWLVDNAEVDHERVAIMGASYGGYMALAAATFTPGEFAAQIDFFGISDMKTLVESYPSYWKVYRSFTFKKWGDPENPEHAEYQYERSPIHFVDQVKTPLLVVQGENDPHVPREQSDRLVEALAGRDVPVHYLVIPGEGHGFSKSENRLNAYQAADRFLKRYLQGEKEIEVLTASLEPRNSPHDAD